MNSIQFLAEILGAFRCGRCILVIGVQNPIHSILLLIRVFFLGTLLLFFVQREYFARLFLIVYVGAIVVLFLFIIRRLELKRIHVSRRLRDLFSYRSIVLAFLLIEVFFLFAQNLFHLQYFFYSFKDKFSLSFLLEANTYSDRSKIIHRTDQLRALGGVLYTEYKTSLFLGSVLLFLSRVGALAVSLSLSSDSQTKNRFFVHQVSSIKRQDVNYQSIRHPDVLINAFRSNLKLEFLFFKMSFYISLVRNPLVARVSNHIDGYPTPSNLSYL
jgi:NADH-quinone oxidoreductase subunit J